MGQDKGVLLEKLFFVEFYVNTSALSAPLRVLGTTPRWAVGPSNTRQGRRSGTKQRSTRMLPPAVPRAAKQY